MSAADVAGVVLAAGRGNRLRPLTDLRPKPLCPIANRPLLDWAMDRLTPHTGAGPDHVAVNVHHLAPMIVAHLDGRATVSEEQPVALGTAGALGRLRPWLAGRPVLVTNADAYLPEGLAELMDGWDGRRVRLLGKETGRASDFGTQRYVGACLLPWSAVRTLDERPAGLYERLWRAAYAGGELEIVPTAGPAIDCGTPRDYLAANLHATGGESVLGAGAVVEGQVTRSVVWPDGYVGPDEHLVDAIRAGTRSTPVTVQG